MKPCSTLSLMMAATGFALTTSAVHAALVVDWGGNYVSNTAGTQVFQNGSVAARNYGGFTAGDPQLISPANRLSGTTPFYGWVTWPAETPGKSPTGFGGQVLNNGSADQIELKRGYTDLSAVLLWKQADFLNGLNTGNVGFDSTSTVSMNLKTYAAFDPGRVVIRLSGGTQDGYYISSEAPFNGTSEVNGTTVRSANLTSLTWLAYNPASSLDTFGSVTNLVSGGQISHVSEVGFYFSESTGAANTDATAVRLDSFEVSALSVPEPASIAFLIGAGGLTLLRRRR